MPVVAAVNIAAVVIFVLIIAGSVVVGAWLGKRLTRLAKRHGAPDVSLRESLKLQRAQLHTELTPGERRFAYGYTALGVILPPTAIGLVVFGTRSTRGVGIGLLLLALLVMAVPISPFLRARVRRREERTADGK
jgi:hypothetical protein